MPGLTRHLFLLSLRSIFEENIVKILFVLNNFYMQGNGLASSARRTVQYLKEAGEDVRVLSGPNPDPNGPQPDFLLKRFDFPFVQPIVTAQGYQFAASVPEVMEEAVRWADVVHLEEPFVIEDRLIKIAEKQGKPISATYHLHPENITNSLGPLRNWKGLNRKILRSWCDLTFSHCSFVQCPTENVQDRLRRYHLPNPTYVISNGVEPDESIRPVDPPKGYDDPERPLHVAYIGRLTLEKDQDTLLDAMRYSKFARRIQLHFAGKGPDERRIKRKAHKLFTDGVLAYDPVFTFENRDGLRRMAAEADLCVHCATVEVEGLSIMEAMQQGVVPVIASGRYSGTSQFAINKRSVFPEKNPEALAHRIDYWLSRPAERWATGQRYVEHMKQYDIRRSVEQLIVLFKKAAGISE